MKRNKRCLVIGVAAVSLLLSGCGTGLYEMTAEEEELIIQSAAYLVAKHNIQQKDGVSNIYIEEEIETESPSPSESESESESESTSEENTPSGGGSNSDAETTKPGVALAEAIGHASDLKITYTGSKLSASYMEGGAYSVDAEAGNIFYVMKFKVTNTTDKDVTLNNAKLNPIFRVTEGAATAKAAITFLSTDLSTYNGKISAGKTVELVLLFELPKAKAEALKEPKLQITIDKVTKTVKL